MADDDKPPPDGRNDGQKEKYKDNGQHKQRHSHPHHHHHHRHSHPSDKEEEEGDNNIPQVLLPRVLVTDPVGVEKVVNFDDSLSFQGPINKYNDEQPLTAQPAATDEGPKEEEGKSQVVVEWKTQIPSTKQHKRKDSGAGKSERRRSTTSMNSVRRQSKKVQWHDKNKKTDASQPAPGPENENKQAEKIRPVKYSAAEEPVKKKGSLELWGGVFAPSDDPTPSSSVSDHPPPPQLAQAAKYDAKIQTEKPKEKKKKKHKRDSKQREKQKETEKRGEMAHPRNRKLVERKRPHMSRLLHVLKQFDEHKDENLAVLQKFGLPPQNALLALCLKDDGVPYDFGNFIKLMYSPSLQAYAPINTANSYMPISKDSPAINAIRYRGVKMHPDEFVKTESLKAAKKHEELGHIKAVCVDQEHYEFLKELALQQMSSLPITIMYEILNEQIKVVEKCCKSYSKSLGSSNPRTKNAQTHLMLMQKHLQAFEFLGLQPLPPLSVLRKFEQPPTEENPDFTSSSSSEVEEEELEQFLQQQGNGPKTHEQKLQEEALEEENIVLDEKRP